MNQMHNSYVLDTKFDVRIMYRFLNLERKKWDGEIIHNKWLH
jgi:hypothetical protein